MAIWGKTSTSLATVPMVGQWLLLALAVLQTQSLGNTCRISFTAVQQRSAKQVLQSMALHSIYYLAFMSEII